MSLIKPHLIDKLNRWANFMISCLNRSKLKDTWTWSAIILPNLNSLEFYKCYRYFTVEYKFPKLSCKPLSIPYFQNHLASLRHFSISNSIRLLYRYGYNWTIPSFNYVPKFPGFIKSIVILAFKLFVLNIFSYNRVGSFLVAVFGIRAVSEQFQGSLRAF